MSIRDTLRRLLRPSSSAPRAERPSARSRSFSPSSNPYSSVLQSQLHELERQRMMMEQQRLRAQYEMQNVAHGYGGVQLLGTLEPYLREVNGRGNRRMAFTIGNMDTNIAQTLRDSLEEAQKTEPVYEYSGDDAVAVAVAEPASAKTEEVKKKLENNKKELEVEERTIKEKQRRVENLKKSTSQLEAEYAKISDKDRAAFIEEFRQHITRLKRDERIEKFEVDASKRIIVTTNPLTIMKTYWRKPRVAGKYQIRIDFSKREWATAINVLNITQRYEYYDSPTISNTSCCWGNIAPDIEADFKSHNLYEIVSDMIDYISSPNDNDGYLSDNDEGEDRNGVWQKKGWERFCRLAKPMPAGFSFEMHEQNSRSRIVPGINVTEDQRIAVDETMIIADGTVPAQVFGGGGGSMGEVTMGGAGGGAGWGSYVQYYPSTSSWAVSSIPASEMSSPMISMGNTRVSLNNQQSLFMRELERVGLTPTAAYHYTGLVMPNGSAPVLSFELVDQGDFYYLYVEKEVSTPDTSGIDPSQENIELELERRVMRARRDAHSRYVINKDDAIERLQEELRQRRTILRVISPSSENQHRERELAMEETARRLTRTEAHTPPTEDDLTQNVSSPEGVMGLTEAAMAERLTGMMPEISESDRLEFIRRINETAAGDGTGTPEEEEPRYMRRRGARTMRITRQDLESDIEVRVNPEFEVLDP